MNILITGVAGFIGSHLADALVHDHRVTGIDTFVTGRRENLNPDMEFWQVDVTVFGGTYDLIIHCAARYHNPDAWFKDIDTNTVGCAHVAHIAQQTGARVIYFQTALPPQSSYAISKIAGQQYLELAGIPLTVFRLANVYGPRNVSGPIPTFYKRLSAGERCTVATTTRDMVYIDDLVDCVLHAIDQNITGTHNISTGTQTPISHLYAHVEAHFPAQEPLFVTPDTDDVGALEVDPSPEFPVADRPLAEGVNKAVAWYRDYGVFDTYTHLRVA